MTFSRPAGPKGGFTLIELLVGVAVSGLVALFLFWMIAQDVRFKALERARASVREKVQVALDLFQEDFRAIESLEGLEVRPTSFYVRSSGKGLLTLDWGVQFKRWLHTSSGNPPGFQPLWVVWGAKRTSDHKDWTLYRIVQREAYRQRIEVSRLELGPLERAELHVFGLDNKAKPGKDALIQLEEAYPFSVPQSALSRLTYAELELEATAKTLASESMFWTFGQNYKPYRFIARVQPRNLEASLLVPKLSEEDPRADGEAMERVDYILGGIKTVTIEAIQAGLQALETAVSLASMATGAATAAPTSGAGAAAGGAGAIAAPAIGTAAQIIMPVIEALIGKLLDWLVEPLLRARATPGVIAYCEPALSNPIEQTGQSATEGEDQAPKGKGAPPGRATPRGVGFGVGGTPPGHGGAPASLRAMKSAGVETNGPKPGNRFGNVGKSSQAGRGTSLPSQSHGQGYAFGRAGKAQHPSGKEQTEGAKDKGSQEETSQKGEPPGSTPKPQQGSSTWSTTFTQAIDTSPWKESWLAPRGFFVARYEGYLFNQAQEVNPYLLAQQASETLSPADQEGSETKGEGKGEGQAPKKGKGAPPGRATPRGVGFGVGGTPPGHGGAPASLRAMKSAGVKTKGPKPGNRFGNVGKSSQAGRGTSLPGQSQGQGYAFGRAGKAQHPSGKEQTEGAKEQGKAQSQEPPPLLPKSASGSTGIRFVPESQSPYLALLGLPLNASLDQERKAELSFEGDTFVSEEWGKVFVFKPFFLAGQSTPSHPLPVGEGAGFDIQVLNSMDNITVGDILAALFAALPNLRRAYTATLPFLKMLRTTAEGIDQIAQVLGQAASLMGGAGSSTGQGAPPGGATPRGVGFGVGGTPPGHGGAPASLRTMKSAGVETNGPKPGNRFGNVGKSSQAGRGTSLPGQSQGQGKPDFLRLELTSRQTSGNDQNAPLGR